MILTTVTKKAVCHGFPVDHQLGRWIWRSVASRECEVVAEEWISDALKRGDTAPSKVPLPLHVSSSNINVERDHVFGLGHV